MGYFVYTAIMIEPRKHNAISLVVNNMLECLSDIWEIVVCVGDENEAYVNTIVKGLHSHRVRVVNIKLQNMDHLQYSQLMATPSFYNHIPTEMFMIFQTDSIINRNNKHFIEEFLQYDYVGAPWRDGYVGNGGISIRRKSKMLEILKQIPYEYGIYEDKYFSLSHFESCPVSIYKPTYEHAQKFSVETVFCPDFFAVHKPWLYVKPKELELMVNACPNLRELMDCQSVANND